LTEPDNTSYSGMMGNMILFLAYRQDQVAKRLNTKIERLDQRLTVLEERERAK
jgi:chaperonin cofactor prefoldin